MHLPGKLDDRPFDNTWTDRSTPVPTAVQLVHLLGELRDGALDDYTGGDVLDRQRTYPAPGARRARPASCSDELA